MCSFYKVSLIQHSSKFSSPLERQHIAVPYLNDIVFTIKKFLWTMNPHTLRDVPLTQQIYNKYYINYNIHDCIL